MNQSSKLSTAKAKKVDVLKTAEELATIIKNDASFIEKQIVARGDEILGIFSDDSFRGSFKNFDKMKIEALKLVIEDLSLGGTTLLSSTIGLTFKNNKIQTYITPFGTPASGNIVYSVSLKDRAAFKNWRNSGAEGEFELSQDDINAAIYRLSVAWSLLI